MITSSNFLPDGWLYFHIITYGADHAKQDKQKFRKMAIYTYELSIWSSLRQMHLTSTGKNFSFMPSYPLH